MPIPSVRSGVKLIHWLLYGLMVAVPVVFYQHIMYPFMMPKIIIFQGLIELLVALWIGLAILHPPFRPRWRPITTVFFIFLAVLTAAALAGADSQVSLWSTPLRAFGIVAWWHLFALYLSLVSLGREIAWRKVWWVSLLVSGYVSLTAIFSAHSSVLDAFFLHQGSSRPGGSFGNPAFLAGYALLHIFIGAHVFLKESGRGAFRWVAGGLVGVNVLALFYTQTRGDIVGLAAGLGAFFFFQALAARRAHQEKSEKSKGSFGLFSRRNVWALLFVALLLLGGVFLATRKSSVWSSIPGVSRLSASPSLEDGLTFRLYAWRAGLQAFLERPWFGWGWENYNLAFQKHYNPKLLTSSFSETFWDKPHNIYIEYLVVAGVPGLAAFLALLGVVAWTLWKRQDGAAWFAFLGAYMVRSIVIFDTIGIFLLMGLFLAYAAREDFENTSADEAKTARVFVLPLAYLPYAFAVIMAVPIYLFGVRTWSAAAAEYKGLNYYILGDMNSSLYWYQEALAVAHPYQDYVRLDFASQVQNADQNGNLYPGLSALVKRLAAESQTIIDNHPRNYFYYVTLAGFKNEFHRFDKNYLADAQSLEQKALALSPNRQQVYYLIAKTQLWQGKADEAYKTFEHVISLNPNAGDPHFYLGLLAFQQGDEKKGREELARALVLGRDARTSDEASTVATYLGDSSHDYVAAARYYEKALTLEKAQSKANSIKLKLGIAYYFAGDKTASAKVFRDLMQSVDLTKSPIYPDLLPLLNDIGVSQ